MGIVFAWGIFQEHLFDLVPVARDTFVRSMGHGLVVLDEDGNLVDINPTAMRMLGIRTKQDQTSVESILARWPLLDGCWWGQSETSCELQLYVPEGLKWVDAHSSFLYDGKGACHGRVIALWDITRRKQDEESLKEAKAQSELYLDLMSHDIRNMNMIGMGFLEQAISPQVNDSKKQEFMQKSMRSLENSTRLVENVEKMQRACSDEFKLYNVDASQMLTQMLANYSCVPGVKATFEYSIPAGCVVVANDLLYDVFTNLIGNAIKHGGPGVRVAVRVQSKVIDQKTLYEFSFEDDGCGIPDDIKERIFNRLQRGKAVAPGRGIGLYLVRTLVESYNGRVRVEDRVQGDHTQGARFVVMLPAVDK